MKGTTIAILAFFCMVLSALEIAASEQMDLNSHELVEWMQSFDWEILNLFFQWFGEATSTGFLVFSGTLYLSSHQDKGCLCVVSAYLGAAASGVLKTLFTRPRPIWQNTNLLGIVCPKDWGTPSGHSMAAGTPMFLMILLWQKKISSHTHRFFLGFSIILIGIDRIYLGAHFYSQVILGYTYAGLLASILIYGYENQWFVFGNLKFLLKSYCFLIGFAAVSWGCFVIKEPIWVDFWTKNFEGKCKGSINFEKAMGKNLIEGLLVFTIAGVLTGRFLIRNFEFRKTNKVLAYLAFWATVYASLKIEKLFINRPWAVMGQRYCIGVFMTAGLPTLLNYLSNKGHKAFEKQI